MIVLVVGVALLYMLPDYIISTVNSTGTFCKDNTTPAQCPGSVKTCCGDYALVVNAQAKSEQVRGMGFLVIMIAVIWIAISVMASGKK